MGSIPNFHRYSHPSPGHLAPVLHGPGLDLPAHWLCTCGQAKSGPGTGEDGAHLCLGTQADLEIWVDRGVGMRFFGMNGGLNEKIIEQTGGFFSMPCWIIGGYLPTQGFGWYDWIGSKKDVLALQQHGYTVIHSYLVVECEHIPYLKRCNIINIVAYGRFR